uniref:nectin-4-like n=1 Tax=Myxine glutinosa TaxID=7769 RepID=UPI00358DF11F
MMQPAAGRPHTNRPVHRFILPASALILVDEQLEISDDIVVTEGEQVTLICRYKGNDSVSQVTWRFLAAAPLPPPEPRPPPLALATLSPLYGSNFAVPFDGRATFEGSQGPIGPSGGRDGTLHLSEARRADGGTYICVFTLFPRGGLRAGLELQVLVPPQISAFQANPAPVSPSLSSDSEFSHKTFTPALAAICEAWGARPPSTIHWRLSTILERLVAQPNLGHSPVVSPQSSPGGPLWVSRSELWLQPNRTAHGQNATCVVSHPALITDVEKEVNLRVLYAPEVRVEGYDGSWYVNGPGGKLHCMVDSNPPPSVFTWTRMNDTLPAGVRLHNATLDLLAPLTPELAGTYQCHVDNGVGEGQAGIQVNIEALESSAADQLAFPVRLLSLPFAVALPAFFIILCLFLPVALWFRRRRQRRRHGHCASDNDVYFDGFTTAPPPPISRVPPSLKPHNTDGDRFMIVYPSPGRGDTVSLAAIPPVCSPGEREPQRHDMFCAMGGLSSHHVPLSLPQRHELSQSAGSLRH